MKKIITLVAVAVLATITFSCKKDSGLPSSNSSSPTPVLPQTKEFKAVSDWLTLSFAPSATANSTTIHASQPIVLAQPDMSDLKHFAFVRMQGRESYVYQSLSTTIPMQNGNFELSYNLSTTEFKLMVSNTSNPPVIADANIFGSYKYRYVVVSNAIFNRYQIDWTDYSQVAAVLGFQL